jgi:hypothetical protein
MKFPYLPAVVKNPVPSLGGGHTRPRPVIAARVTGSAGTHLLDGLLDTGSDDTVLEEWVAAIIGVDLTNAITRDVGLVGRAKPVRVKYATVRLRVTDGSAEVYEWPSVVASRRRNCAIRFTVTPVFCSSSTRIFAATIAKSC